MDILFKNASGTMKKFVWAAAASLIALGVSACSDGKGVPVA